MKNQMNIRRFLAMLLVLCSLVQYLPIRPQAAEAAADETTENTENTEGTEPDSIFDHITLFVEGLEADFAELSQDEHITLTAMFDLGEGAITSMTWQIYDPNGCQWVPISGADQLELQVGYAMVAEMLNADSLALLNCKITCGGSLYYSDTMQIYVPGADASADADLETTTVEVKAKTTNAGIMPLEEDGDVSGGELVTYTVTVRYTYLNGDEAAQPYKATVKHNNTGLVVNPYSPAIVGYTPYVITADGIYEETALAENQEWRSGSGLKASAVYTKGDTTVYGVKMQNFPISLSSKITSDITYWVVYLPNKVTYTVSHYYQNAVNDDYMLFWVETKEGYVGEMTQATDLTDPALAAKLGENSLANGFVALTPFHDEEIAADGTTQIATYYDRRYYLLTFKLNGGRDMEPIYARYGAPITVTDPVRSGYKFVGWYRLQMERNDAKEIQPRPYVDPDTKEYVRVYTNYLGQLLSADGNEIYSGTSGQFVKMVAGTAEGDYRYYVRQTDGTLVACTPMNSGDMPKTMQYYHAAMIAVWEKTETNVTVVYWLEKADYADESCDVPHTSHTDADGKDAGYSDFAYWCSTTLSDYVTGESLLKYVDKLENPLRSTSEKAGTGAALVTLSQYEQFIPSVAADLNGKVLAIVNTLGSQQILDTVIDIEGNNGLGKDNFSAEEQTVEWKFLLQDDETFVLKSDNGYMAMDANGYMTISATITDDTKFTVGIATDGIYLQRGRNYVNCWSGVGGVGFRGYGERDSGSYFKLYDYKTSTINDPEFNYYYPYFSDLKDLNGTTHDIIVDGDGTTVVNVYFRRREYNLRFFYARSYVKSDGTTQYQVIGGSSYGFSCYEATTTEDLLANIDKINGAWGDVAQPEYNKTYFEDEEFTTKLSFQNTDGTTTEYTYYAFVMKARYGQNIADEWPSDIFSPAERTVKNTASKDGWNGDYAVFSAWNGEYWLKYSVDEANDSTVGADRDPNSGANYTIKGNYQQLDERLLYDPSFSAYYPDADPYYLRGTQIGDTTRYLDFVAFWENGNGTSWSVPKQFHYYIWVQSTDQSLEAQYKATYSDRAVTWNGNSRAANLENLPNCQTEFDAVIERDNEEKKQCTTAYINGVVYDLYDKVNCCDNSEVTSKQTVPGVPGYDDVSSERTRSYPASLSEAITPNSTTGIQALIPYYQNTETNAQLVGTSGTYAKSFTQHYIFNAIEYTITLKNYDHVRDLTGIPYNSDLGANWIKGLYETTPEIVAGKCPQGECYKGFTQDEMMTTYYPAELPEGAYVFAGWYKSPECAPGTEANLDIGMPNYNIILYAKWVPRTYTVQVYQTSDLNNLVYYPDNNGDNKNEPMESVKLEYVTDSPNWVGQNLLLPQVGTLATEGKSYGEYLPSVVQPAGPNTKVTNSEAEIPENMSGLDTLNGTGDIRTHWIFVCWAYMKDGVEHAIDVASYQITDDVQIYAKWTATTAVNYKVEYQLAELYEYDGKLYDNKDTHTFEHEVRFGTDGKLYYLKLDEYGNEVLDANNVWQLKAQTDKKGEPIRIADSLTGMQNEGANRTFTAKTELELYAADDPNNATGKNYQFGYFPLTNSHTMLMEFVDQCNCPEGCECNTGGNTCKGDDCNCKTCYVGCCTAESPECACEENGDECKCVYCGTCGCVTLGASQEHPLTTIFYYVYLTSAPYDVYYLDANLQNLVEPADRKNPDNEAGEALKMVVTETYVPVNGYTPDAFQKTLILSANPYENVIEFHYSTSSGVPYQIIHYVETTSDDPAAVKHENDKFYKIHYSYGGVQEPGDNGFPKLEVPFQNIAGYEYAHRDITVYDGIGADGLPTNDDKKANNHGANETIEDNTDKVTCTETELFANLYDALGKKLNGITITGSGESKVVTLTCAESKHEPHVLSQNIIYYEVNGVKYVVTDIVENTDGTYDVTYHYVADKFEVAGTNFGTYGTVIEVFYDLKEYPYFIYHKAYKTDENNQTSANAELMQIIMGKAAYEATVKGDAWTETQLINKGYAGYTMDREDKTITMTMTMTIQDSAAEQYVNSMTFYYYEKNIDYRYQAVVITDVYAWNTAMTGGAGDGTYLASLAGDSNVSLSVDQQYVAAVNGTPQACEPVYNKDAYTFVGWFLDAECTKPVVSDTWMYAYMGTEYKKVTTTTDEGTTTTYEFNGVAQNPVDKPATLDALLTAYASYDVLQPQKYTGTNYAYNELHEVTQNGKTYVRKTVDLTKVLDANNQRLYTAGVYVGAYAVEDKTQVTVTNNVATEVAKENWQAVYTNQQTFYALFMPAQGELTITRTNLGADFNNEANSFVYEIKRTDAAGVTMYVTIDPQDFKLDANGNYTASVTIKHLPFGTYTVTQVNDWSWRYSDDVQTKALSSTSAYLTAAFGEAMSQNNWLSGFSAALENIYGKMSN